ncbi:preprotein translocase subunit SecE [Propionispora hippei]|uniref:Protein translocase subunit SecE n=1 Tax=Propionispora hippei DSM 15287 TaxID=1123003 RepID=A0A1M6NWI2_9FIRM|nr:preprotein translocase subunit SecE [Propionispora hippei]SHK00065.1 preprotein translocase subunit SecE [Propionispora hippei DSM 15287]
MAAQDTAVQSNGSRGRRFLREVKAELKKVSWPTKQELISYTGVVFVSVLVIAILIWGIDLVYAKLLKIFINK